MKYGRFPHFLCELLLVGSVGLPMATGCAKKAETGKTDGAAGAGAESAAATGEAKGRTEQELAVAAKKLLESLDKANSKFGHRELIDPENAEVFTHIAATSSDPVEIAAALQGMQQAYSAHSKRKAKPDDTFSEVVRKHLKSSDDKLVGYALLAARAGITGKEAREDLVDAVLEVAKKYPGGAGRYAVLDTLRVLSSRHRDDAVSKLFIETLSAPEPYVVSQALHGLSRVGRTLQDTAPLKARVTELSKHADPGVRGRALELLGTLGKDDPQVLALVTAALKDESPYVRSEACDAMARLRHKEGIHDLMKLLGDKADNTYIVKDWSTLTGTPGQLRHDGSPWSRVYDAAMNAIRNLSGGGLKLERVNPKEREQGLDKNAQVTRTWYAENKTKLKDAPAAKAADKAPTAAAPPGAKVTQSLAPTPVPAPVPAAQ